MSVIGIVVSVGVSLLVWVFLAVGLYHLIRDVVRKVRLPAGQMAPRRSPQRAG